MGDIVLARELVAGDIFVPIYRLDDGPNKVLSTRPYNQGAGYVIVDYESLDRGSGGTSHLRRDMPVLRLEYVDPRSIPAVLTASTTPSHLTIFNTREGFYA